VEVGDPGAASSFFFSSPAGAEEKFTFSLNGSLQQIHLVSFSVLKTVEMLRKQLTYFVNQF